MLCIFRSTFRKDFLFPFAAPLTYIFVFDVFHLLRYLSNLYSFLRGWNSMEEAAAEFVCTWFRTFDESFDEVDDHRPVRSPSPCLVCLWILLQ